MRTSASSLMTRALAALVLLVAAWVLFKVVIGIVTSIAMVLAVVVALVALVWAARVLL